MTNTILSPDTNGMFLGAEIEIFGMTGTVVDIEPASDWFWTATVSVRKIGHTDSETITLTVPTDFRTDDGYPATPAAAEQAAAWEREAEDAANDRMHRIESMACDR